MKTATDYEQKIVQADYATLRRLWRAIEAGTTLRQGWEPGKAIEYLVLRAFQLEGADIRWPYQVVLAGNPVEQLDGALYVDGLDCLVECKDWAEPVHIEPIAKLRNQLLRRPSPTVGLVFSRHGYTQPALLLAQFTLPQTILLWTGAEVALALAERRMREGLRLKYRRCVEEGLADYNLREEWK